MYCMFKKSWPNLSGTLLYIMGQDFLDIKQKGIKQSVLAWWFTFFYKKQERYLKTMNNNNKMNNNNE